MDSYYVVMASNASTDLHPQNALTRFHNELPQQTHVEGYKIALQSLHVDTNFGNVPNSVLGTKPHFILFFTEGNTERDVSPVSHCTITDVSLSLVELVQILNAQLLNAKVRSDHPRAAATRLDISVVNYGQRIQISLLNAVLLIHPEMNAWLQFYSANPVLYEGSPITNCLANWPESIFPAWISPRHSSDRR